MKMQIVDYGKMTKNKKAQLKIQQMTFMLLAVTLFFVLVGLIILAFRFSGLKESATALEEKNALLLATKLANSPEFSCGESFKNAKINCIDSDKIMMLKENIDAYSNFWGKDTNIEIRIIYPLSEEKECTLSNYPDCNIINLESKQISSEYSNYVALCRKQNKDGEVVDICSVAKLMINYKDYLNENEQN